MRDPLFWLLFALFIVVNTVNALHKGGDFEVFVEGGQRVRDAAPLYRDSSPGQGVIGPPFQSVLFVPAAWLWERSETAARLLWYLIGVTALVGGVWLWERALGSDDGSEAVNGTGLSWPLLLTLGAIALPVQTNFEHQNLNTVLLCATGGAAWALTRGHRAVGGALVGAATAVKAFPGLLLLYLLARRQSRAAAVGVVTAAALTFSPAFWYGPGAAVGLWTDWLAINRDGGWPIRLQNQSLFAAWARLTVDAAFPLFLLSAAVLAGILLHTAWRRSGDASSSSDLPLELALALMTAVLVSPIAWDHYWVLMFPGFLLVARRLWKQGWLAGWILFGLAAVLVSGISPLVAGASGFDAVRKASGYTVAGVVIVAMTAAFMNAERRGVGRQKKRPE